jgi:hypothetical protein
MNNKSDKIAAATIAQIFGSELLRVDENTFDGEGNKVRNSLRLDPKKILLEGEASPFSHNNSSEKRMIEELQRAAEASYPLPQENDPISNTPHQTGSPNNSQLQTNNSSISISNDSFSLLINELKSINQNLTKIANNIEIFDNVFKRNSSIRHDN